MSYLCERENVSSGICISMYVSSYLNVCVSKWVLAESGGRW